MEDSTLMLGKVRHRRRLHANSGERRRGRSSGRSTEQSTSRATMSRAGWRRWAPEMPGTEVAEVRTEIADLDKAVDQRHG